MQEHEGACRDTGGRYKGVGVGQASSTSYREEPSRRRTPLVERPEQEGLAFWDQPGAEDPARERRGEARQIGSEGLNRLSLAAGLGTGSVVCGGQSGGGSSDVQEGKADRLLQSPGSGGFPVELRTCGQSYILTTYMQMWQIMGQLFGGL